MTIRSRDRSKGYIEVDNSLYDIWHSPWGHDTFPIRSLACGKEWYDALKAPRLPAKQPILTFKGALSELL